MEDFMFNLKFQGRQMKHDSERAMREAKKNEAKVRDNLKKNNKEAAQIYAQQVISYRQEATRYVQMACKMDILGSQLKMQQMNKQMTSDIAKLNVVMAANIAPDQLVATSKTMTIFNDVCEKMGVQQSVVQNMMGNEQQIGVDELMTQIEEEIAVEQVGAIKNVPIVQQQPVQEKVTDGLDELAKKLAML